jgi:hypothetical protein
VDWSANEVILSYDQKFKKLDCLFAADIVCDGTSDIVGPFEASEKRFFSGQVMPTCAEWFGEVNKDYKSLITKLAREATAGDDGMRVSPLVNSDRKGGVFQLMLHQFRRAIGVAIVRGNAKYELGCLHYICESMEEAASASTAHHSTNRWNPSQNGHAG